MEDDNDVADHFSKQTKGLVKNEKDKYQKNHVVDHEIQDNSLPDDHDIHDNPIPSVYKNSIIDDRDNSIPDDHDNSVSDDHDDSISNDHKDDVKHVEILSSDKSKEHLNDSQEECTNGPQEENQHYTQSFRQDDNSSVELEEDFDISDDPIKKKTSTVHDSENITLCWIETTTVKEDNKSSPPKRQVFREFSISFENSAPIPDEYLDCPRMEGEVLPGKPDALKRTSFNEIIDQDVKLSKVVDLTSKSREGNLFVTEYKSIRCSTGMAVTKDVSEWFSDSNHPKKRVEIKVGPQKRNLKPDDGKVKDLSKKNDIVSKPTVESTTKNPDGSDSSEVLGTGIEEKPSKTSVEVGQDSSNVPSTEIDEKSEKQSTTKSPDGSESDDSLPTEITKKPSVENSAEFTQDISCSGENCNSNANFKTTSPEIELDSGETSEVTEKPDKNDDKPSSISREISTDCDDSFEVCDPSELGDNSEELPGSESSQQSLDSEENPDVKHGTKAPDDSGEKIIQSPVLDAKNSSQLGAEDSVTDVNSGDSSTLVVTTEGSESTTKELVVDIEKKPSLDVGEDKKSEDITNEPNSGIGVDRKSLEHHDLTEKIKNFKTEWTSTEEKPMNCTDPENCPKSKDSDTDRSDDAAEQTSLDEDKYSILKPKTLQNAPEFCEGPDCNSSELSQSCEGDCSEKIGSSQSSSEYPEKSYEDPSENSQKISEDSSENPSISDENSPKDSKVNSENDSRYSSTDSTPVENNEKITNGTTAENGGVITSPDTVQPKDTNSINADKPTKPRLALKIKLLLEQINGNKEKKPLVQLEKQLTLKEDLNDPENENLISKIRAFNNSANDLQSIKNLLNCSELENLTDIYLDMNDQIQKELKKVDLQDTYDEIIPDDLDEAIAKHQRRKRDAESTDVKKNITVQIDDIRKCLPEIRSDLKTGLNEIFIKLSSKLKVSDDHINDGKSSNTPETTTTPGEVKNEALVSRDKRSTGGGNDNKEVHKWSKERIRKSADGSQLRSVTELTILEDREGLHKSH